MGDMFLRRYTYECIDLWAYSIYTLRRNEVLGSLQITVFTIVHPAQTMNKVGACCWLCDILGRLGNMQRTSRISDGGHTDAAGCAVPWLTKECLATRLTASNTGSQISLRISTRCRSAQTHFQQPCWGDSKECRAVLAEYLTSFQKVIRFRVICRGSCAFGRQLLLLPHEPMPLHSPLSTANTPRQHQMYSCGNPTVDIAWNGIDAGTSVHTS